MVKMVNKKKQHNFLPPKKGFSICLMCAAFWCVLKYIGKWFCFSRLCFTCLWKLKNSHFIGPANSECRSHWFWWVHSLLYRYFWFCKSSLPFYTPVWKRRVKIFVGEISRPSSITSLIPWSTLELWPLN